MSNVENGGGIGMDSMENDDNGGARGNRAILVAAGEERHLEELRRLAGTLGLKVCGQLEQPRRDNAGYLGSGKRQELRELGVELSAEMVVTDDELTSSQARKLERDSGLPVVDRTELIINIFEAHAKDAPSKLQVELAELEYTLPRARGMWTHLERQEGGSGSSSRGATRGPGEQQLEYDRRMIRERIQSLKKRLERERNAREVRSSRLRSGGPPIVTLVGYTNAGKTTILNALSGAGRSVRDWLFETLETTTRTVEGGSLAANSNNNSNSTGTNSGNGNGAEIDTNNNTETDGGSYRPDFVLTDTVGFIRKLPTQLVESFAGTLESARDADVVVLCADASSPTLRDEVETVLDTLRGAEIDESNLILCLNKIDRPQARENLSKNEYELYSATETDSRPVKISALRDATPLAEEIYASIARTRTHLTLLIPHDRHDLAAELYGSSEILTRENRLDGVLLEVTVPPERARKYLQYKTT